MELPQAFKGNSKLSTWIFAIAYRKSLKALRNHQDPLEDTIMEESASLEPSPEEEFGRTHARALLLQSLAKL